MEQPGFWDNPEKARQVIGQLKPINSLLNKTTELQTQVDDLVALAELANEDEGMATELAAELPRGERLVEEFELQAMFDRPGDVSNAFVRINAGSGGTEACDWAQ